MDNKISAIIAIIIFTLGIIIGGFFIVQKLSSDPQDSIFKPNQNSINISRLYPNPNLTIGSVIARQKSEVCYSGYSASVRNVPLPLRKKVFDNYGVAYPPEEDSVQLDHFINLAIGGSNKEDNLWVQPCPECKWKDKVENYLHKRVCDGGMSLEEAQRAISSDWYAIYVTIKDEKIELEKEID
jgi:hypothetical protein